VIGSAARLRSVVRICCARDGAVMPPSDGGRPFRAEQLPGARSGKAGNAIRTRVPRIRRPALSIPQSIGNNSRA
jgi:hypothetical protein